MTELSQDIAETARKNEKIILHRLAEVGQKNVAELLGVDESTVSRYKNGFITQVAQLLAALGQVPSGKHDIILTPEKFFCITELAKDGATMFFNDRERLLQEIQELKRGKS